jgi:hypothetical protein
MALKMVSGMLTMDGTPLLNQCEGGEEAKERPEPDNLLFNTFLL